MESQEIKLGKYKHYKGDMVEVTGIAKHSETLDELVIYRHISGKRMEEKNFWVRPFKMFTEDIEIDGKKIPRFEYIGENE
jgi:hypothetical protein